MEKCRKTDTPFTRKKAVQAYQKNGVFSELKREAYQAGYEQALKDLADEAIETEDTLILKGLIDAKSGELYNMKENKELLKDFCHKIGGSAVNVIIKKR